MSAPTASVVTVSQSERSKLRRELCRFDTAFFLMSAMVVVDTLGAIAIGGGQAFTWLIVLIVTFFIPSALCSAELGAALPEEGGAYVWVRTTFGGLAASMTTLFYRASTPLLLGVVRSITGYRGLRRITRPTEGVAPHG